MFSKSDQVITKINTISAKSFYGDAPSRRRSLYNETKTRNFYSVIGRKENRYRFDDMTSSRGQYSRTNPFPPKASSLKINSTPKNFYNERRRATYNDSKARNFYAVALARKENRYRFDDVISNRNQHTRTSPFSSKGPTPPKKVRKEHDASPVDMPKNCFITGDELAPLLSKSSKGSLCKSTPIKLARSSARSRIDFDAEEPENNASSERIATEDKMKEATEKCDKISTDYGSVEIQKIENDKSVDVNLHCDETPFLDDDVNPDDPYPLKNLGNTCYMNSIVQSIFSLSFFMSDLNNMMSRLDGDIKDTLVMTKTFLSLYREYSDRRNSIKDQTEPGSLDKRLTDLKDCVGNKSSSFKLSFQQDAAEFFDHIISSIEEEFDSLSGTNDYNPIKRNFQIDLNSSLKCTKCSHVSKLPKTKLNALYLSIDDETRLLQQAVFNYFKEEKCDHRCDQKGCDGTEKNRAMFVSNFPKILFLQLGRYSKCGEKRQEAVEVPELIELPTSSLISMHDINVSSSKDQYYSRKFEDLTNQTNLTPKKPRVVGLMKTDPVDPDLRDSDEENTAEYKAVYRLMAVVCHLGNTLTRGHYIAYLHQDDNDKWYECDDTSITESSLEKVQEGSKSSAYCLFYSYKYSH